MDLCRRVVIFLTFVLFCAGIVLICAALSTEHWIVSHPVRFSVEEKAAEGQKANRTVVNNGHSVVYSGLFSGSRRLDWNLGLRVKDFYVRDELRSCGAEDCDSFFTLGLWVSVILFAVLGMLWGAVGVVFALINTVIRPIETITGQLGLYLWTALAAFCTLTSVVLFVIQFYTRILHNVLLPNQRAGGLTSEDRASFDYSFWLLVGAVGLFLLNIPLLLVSGWESKSRRPIKEKDMPQLTDGGVLMY